MPRKSGAKARSRQKPSVEAAQADERASTSGAESAAKPPFDVTKVEGFIPIEQLKNGWTLPEYDPDNPEHERAARSLAELLMRVQARQASRTTGKSRS